MVWSVVLVHEEFYSPRRQVYNSCPCRESDGEILYSESVFSAVVFRFSVNCVWCVATSSMARLIRIVMLRFNGSSTSSRQQRIWFVNIQMHTRNCDKKRVSRSGLVRYKPWHFSDFERKKRYLRRASRMWSCRGFFSSFLSCLDTANPVLVSPPETEETEN